MNDKVCGYTFIETSFDIFYNFLVLSNTSRIHHFILHFYFFDPHVDASYFQNAIFDGVF